MSPNQTRSNRPDFTYAYYESYTEVVHYRITNAPGFRIDTVPQWLINGMPSRFVQQHPDQRGDNVIRAAELHDHGDMQALQGAGSIAISEQIRRGTTPGMQHEGAVHGTPRSRAERAATALERRGFQANPSATPAETGRLHVPKIYFSRIGPHAGFTPSSNHPVEYQERTYPTGEHLFQALRFPNYPEVAEAIRLQDTPSEAIALARSKQEKCRPGWIEGGLNVEAMEEMLWDKFAQHDELRQELLAINNAVLVSNSKDIFWGIDDDGQGRNMLGEALQTVRVKLRTDSVMHAMVPV